MDTQIFYYSTNGTYEYSVTISTSKSNRTLSYTPSNLTSTETCNSLPKVVVDQRSTFNLDSDNITLTINSSNSFSVSEIFVRLLRCQVNRCQVCLSSTICTSCSSPYLLMKNSCVMSCDVGYYTNTLNRSCVYNCPPGMFTDLANYQCLVCQPPCLTCTSTTECLSCMPSTTKPTYLEGKKCVEKCSSNMTFGDNSTLTCMRCVSPCEACSFIGTNCTSCSSGYLEPVAGVCVA